jgi:hypothetical protein
MRKKSMLLACAMTVLAVVGATLTTTSPAAAAGGAAASGPAPSVTAVGPDAGQFTGGTRVSVRGTNFTSVDAVLFGTTPGTDVMVSSATSLTVIAPAHAPGIVDLKVIARGRTSRGSAADRFTFSTMTPRQAPVPSDNLDDLGGLNRLTCPVRGWCLATGKYYDYAADSPAELQTLSDGVWTAVRAPLPPGTNRILSEYYEMAGASCAAAGECIAVGSYTGGDSPLVPLIETLAGGVWAPTVPPLPSDADPSSHGASLTAIACPTRHWCVAVGSYTGFDGLEHGLVETLSGGAWTAARVDSPPGGGAPDLLSVACTAARSCVAVGSYSDAAAGGGLIETLSGNLWTPQAAPLAPGGVASGAMQSVTCPALRWCAAIGYSSDTAPLAYTWSAGRWAARVVPLPPDARVLRYGQNALSSLACPAIWSCVAVGQYTSNLVSPTLGRNRALIETLDHHTWGTTGAAVPYASILRSVACAAPGSCVAVGEQDFPGSPGGGPVEGLAETLAGGTWTYGTVPVPADTISVAPWTWTALYRVSCPSGQCVAVGFYNIGSNNRAALIERWGLRGA